MPRLVVETDSGKFVRDVEVIDSKHRGRWSLVDFTAAWEAGLAADERERQQREAHHECDFDDHQFVVGNSECIICGAEVDDA